MASLHQRRMARLEAVSLQLRALYHDHAQCLVAEKNAKAELYLSGMNDDAGRGDRSTRGKGMSHSEREGFSNARAVRNVEDTILVMGEIRKLEEERDFLKFSIEHDTDDDALIDQAMLDAEPVGGRG